MEGSDPVNAGPFVNFCEERHALAIRKAAGMAKPWTKDPILQRYRFCNVYRELDSVTRWIRFNYSGRWHAHRDHWFAMAVARLVNWPDTLHDLRVAVLPWKPEEFCTRIGARQALGKQTYGAAYIVSTNGQSIPKDKYLAESVLGPLWDARAVLRPRASDTLQSFHERLLDFNGMGSFIAAQIVADEKNVPTSKLANAPDWYTWAAPGPGSLRGMNRIMGNGAKKSGINAKDFAEVLDCLRGHVNARFRLKGYPEVHAQDLQNCLCEFDKYERVRLGEGKPRQQYPGVA